MLGLNLSGLLLLAVAAMSAHAPIARFNPTTRACRPGDSVSVKIAATTDVHGHILGWNYYGNRPDSALGLSRAATIVDSVRKADPGRVILVDAGDMLEGTPLAYVAARMSADRHNPIIAAMNTMRYDAVVIGNHEFNYGVPYLDSAISQATFPVLAANVTRNGANAYRSFTIVQRAGIRIGIIGATTPGSNLWDASNLASAKLHIGDLVAAVRVAVGQARAAGADAIVVVLHSGLDGPSSYDTASSGVANENVAGRVAATIPGIDVVIYGHTHRENPGELIGSTLVMQPKNWAASVAIATVPVACDPNGRWSVSIASGTVVKSSGHQEDSSVVRAATPTHRATLTYVNSVIGSTPDTWRSDSARIRPTGITGFILDVERRAAGADIASASAFDLHAHFGPGSITVAQIAQLYPYDNTLLAISITGEQLKEYLEYSSRYYKTEPDRSLVVDKSVQGYNFDMVSGVDYTIDVSRPVGQRVGTLTLHGRAVKPTDTFVMAVNNYRQSGGGGYSMLRDAPVVYDKQTEIRDLLIEAVQTKHFLRKSDYDEQNWSILKPGQHP
jgi:2',3'-cyclic-nucleotide 2'-phosphodiesterase/3'-nucleotidase